jgi:ribosomal protein L32
MRFAVILLSLALLSGVVLTGCEAQDTTTHEHKMGECPTCGEEHEAGARCPRCDVYIEAEDYEEAKTN